MLDRYVDQVRLIVDVLPHIAKEDVFALKGGTAIVTPINPNLSAGSLPTTGTGSPIRLPSLHRLSKASE